MKAFRSVAGVGFFSCVADCELQPTNIRNVAKAIGQSMLRPHCEIEDARAFGLERSPANSVEVEHACMGGKARKDGRTGVAISPVDNFGQRSPVRLARQFVGDRLGAGDDHAIQANAMELAHRRIGLTNVVRCRRRALNPIEGDQLDVDNEGAGGCLDEAGELALGGHEGAIGHVIDQPDAETPPWFGSKNGGRGVQPWARARPLASQLNLVHWAAIRFGAAIKIGDVVVAASAWSRSSMISAQCSMPTLMRMVSGLTPACACSWGVIWRWVVEAG